MLNVLTTPWAAVSPRTPLNKHSCHCFIKIQVSVESVPFVVRDQWKLLSFPRVVRIPDPWSTWKVWPWTEPCKEPAPQMDPSSMYGKLFKPWYCVTICTTCRRNAIKTQSHPFCQTWQVSGGGERATLNKSNLTRSPTLIPLLAGGN